MCLRIASFGTCFGSLQRTTGRRQPLLTPLRTRLRGSSWRLLRLRQMEVISSTPAACRSSHGPTTQLPSWNSSNCPLLHEASAEVLALQAA